MIQEDFSKSHPVLYAINGFIKKIGLLTSARVVEDVIRFVS